MGRSIDPERLRSGIKDLAPPMKLLTFHFKIPTMSIIDLKKKKTSDNDNFWGISVCSINLEQCYLIMISSFKSVDRKKIFSQFCETNFLRLNLKIGERKMKKIVILSEILFLFSVNILAQKTITCKKGTFEGHPACLFSGVTIGPNEAVTIKTDPANLDVNSITAISLSSSSIHSIPSEVFTKFPNLIFFRAFNVKLREVKPNTFEKGKKLEQIRLHYNALTFLPLDTFKGEYFQFLAYFQFLKRRYCSRFFVRAMSVRPSVTASTVFPLFTRTVRKILIR